MNREFMLLICDHDINDVVVGEWSVKTIRKKIVIIILLLSDIKYAFHYHLYINIAIYFLLTSIT